MIEPGEKTGRLSVSRIGMQDTNKNDVLLTFAGVTSVLYIVKLCVFCNSRLTCFLCGCMFKSRSFINS